MKQTLTLAQQYAGKKLPDEQWAKILGCDATDVPEFRDYLQSATKICVVEFFDAKGAKKYTINQYTASKNDEYGFVWWLDARCTLSFGDYKTAERFIYEQWIPNIIFPSETHDGKPIPDRAYLMVRATPAPGKDSFILPSGVVRTMTPQELALCKKYHGR